MLGVAAIATVAAARTREALVESGAAAALAEGLRVGFLSAVAVAAVGALLALLLLRGSGKGPGSVDRRANTSRLVVREPPPVLPEARSRPPDRFLGPLS